MNLYTFRWTNPEKIGYIEANSMWKALEIARWQWNRSYHFFEEADTNMKVWRDEVMDAKIEIAEIKK